MPHDDLSALSRRVNALEDAVRTMEREGKRAAQEAEYSKSLRRTTIMAILVPIGLVALSSAACWSGASVTDANP